jgi:pimeloyl-ACP methyl ester carboxylesterase
MMIPGFLSSEKIFTVMNRYLRFLGHHSYTWGLGPNLGLRRGHFFAALSRLESIYEEHGKEVVLIGHSLGGVISRELAKQRPDLVSHVITLGSPFRDPKGTTSTGSAIYHTMNPEVPEEHLSEFERSIMNSTTDAPPVPQSAIYSRADGHTHWTGCIQMEGVGAPLENIEVHSSHIGMTWNGLVLYVIADRLAMKTGAWKAFDRSGWRKKLYPEPVLAKT